MRIAFRTDSSSEIGIGHLVRCLVLADEFRRRGHECIFICGDLPGHQGAMVMEHGHQLFTLSQNSALRNNTDIKMLLDQDITETRSLITTRRVEWLVIDHYAIDERWEAGVRSEALAILAIDDLADRVHDCDVLIDQNPFPDADKRYRNRVGPGTLLMLGPEYALLRSEFPAMRRNLDRHFEEASRLLVGFGGADPTNATERVVSALLEGLGETMEMVVAAGPANPHFARLRGRWEGRRHIQLHRNLKCMAEVMAEADLAIGGGGVNALERCALGLPSLTYAIADNQVIPSETLSGIGAAQFMGRIENFDSEELIKAVRQLVDNAHARASLSRKGMDLVDGFGASRAVNALLKHE